jgi:hypothetical protein
MQHEDASNCSPPTSNPAAPEAVQQVQVPALAQQQQQQPVRQEQQQQQQQQQQQHKPELQLHLVEFVVAVTTGTALGAGTDADVFLALTGEHGSLGERQLTGSSTHGNMFERGEQGTCWCKKQ